MRLSAPPVDEGDPGASAAGPTAAEEGRHDAETLRSEVTMSFRKSRAVRILAAVLGIPLVGIIGAAVWINRVADERWAAAEARILALSAAFPEGDRRAEPEHITEASKENQIHFVAAIRLAAPSRFGKDATEKLVSGRRLGAEADALLNEAAEWMDRLHQGARRIAASPADFPPRWHGDWDFWTLSYMMNCGVLLARQQRKQGMPFDGALTLLDALQLARFAAISGTSVNREFALETLPPTIAELGDLLCSDPLTADQLQLVEHELEPLEAAMKSSLRDLEPRLARWAQGLLTCDLRADGYLNGAPYRWRVLLPGRLMKAEAFEFAERKARLLLALEGRPYAEMLAQRDLLMQEGMESLNPIIRRVIIEGERYDWREEPARKAQLRLLRAATHYRASGEVLNLEDPLGSTLHHASSGTRMRIWSNGEDGADDGGSFTKDLLLEIPRRP